MLGLLIRSRFGWSVVCVVTGVVVVILIFGAFQLRAKGQSNKTLVPQEHAEVVLTAHGFEPREVTLVRGGTVTFTTTAGRPFWPASNLHPDHTIYSDFDPKEPIDPNDSWTFTFNRAGDWGMHDHIRSYYRGVIHVIGQ